VFKESAGLVSTNPYCVDWNCSRGPRAALGANLLLCLNKSDVADQLGADIAAMPQKTFGGTGACLKAMFSEIDRTQATWR
jgi:hypothetical protein